MTTRAAHAHTEITIAGHPIDDIALVVLGGHHDAAGSLDFATDRDGPGCGPAGLDEYPAAEAALIVADRHDGPFATAIKPGRRGWTRTVAWPTGRMCNDTAASQGDCDGDAHRPRREDRS